MTDKEKKIIDQANEYIRNRDMDKAEALVDNYVKTHPRSTEMLLRMAMIELTAPFEDGVRAISYLDKILEYDPANKYALLLFAESSFFNYWGTEDPDFDYVIDRISSVNKDDSEYIALVEYYRSLYYYHKRNSDMEFKSLLRSAELDSTNPNVLFMLGDYYTENSNKEKAKYYISKGLENIKHIYPEKSDFEIDPTDYNEYINELTKGTYVPMWRYKEYKQKLMKLESSIKI